MNSFNRNPFASSSGNSMNPFSNNSNMNQTRIVSNYTQVSKDGGRISTDEVRKNMQQVKGNDVKLTVFPNPHGINFNQEQQNMNVEQNSVPAQAQNSNPTPQVSSCQNNFDQAQMARERMNSFRNIGLK